MMNATSGCPLVLLAGHVAVPLPALRLAWALEARGCHFSTDGETLVVGPGRLLTDSDREAIRVHKPALLALAGYKPQVVA